MVLLFLVYLGGVFTIVSPCILPVLPFVFARADRPFLRSGLPLLFGMAAAFTVIASLAAVGGSWVVSANQYARIAALALLALFGLTLLVPALADRIMQPLAAAGGRLSRAADAASPSGGGIASSALLGVATGLLWAPCAGPLLGLVLTGAALNGANTRTSSLLLAYAAGAATSLALALIVGGRVLAVLKRSLGVSEWIRSAVGVAVVAAVIAIGLGLDTGVLTRLSLSGTTSIEQRLLDAYEPAPDASASVVGMTGGSAMMMARTGGHAGELPIEGALPPLTGAVQWLNSPALTAADLEGKVILVDFWTYSCINCLRAIPYVRAWAEKYKDRGLVVIGVHTPEFAFEKDVDNVKKAVADLQIRYPVAIDNVYAIWRSFNNQYWPAHYFIDAKGQIRHHRFGEGDYEGSERVIQQLLAEVGTEVAPDLVSVTAAGAEAAPDLDAMRSPETYIGYERGERFVAAGGAVRDAAHVYQPGTPGLNEWGLDGNWTIGGEQATLNTAGGRLVYRFHARDLHLVLGATDARARVRFRLTIDGVAPGESHGSDADAEGNGVVSTQRLYQLIRQRGPVADHLFEIRFLDPGVQVFAFTFG